MIAKSQKDENSVQPEKVNTVFDFLNTMHTSPLTPAQTLATMVIKGGGGNTSTNSSAQNVNSQNKMNSLFLTH